MTPDNDAMRAFENLMDYLQASACGKIAMKYDKFDPKDAVKTIRTELLKSAQVDGLVKALERIVEHWKDGESGRHWTQDIHVAEKALRKFSGKGG